MCITVKTRIIRTPSRGAFCLRMRQINENFREFQILGAITTIERASVDFQLADLRTWKDFMKRYERE